ncbi:hypothetical protein KY335_04780 [Candidatus Woesearchaeota archaeon]|nr:hypothetical protein [Candidatus Woesearchaeota archaeon]MBW3014523.1 hypothetical protein [Candidatus Woesearchaeota archaeon]
MIQMPYDQIIKKLVTNTSLSEKEINDKIAAKMGELSGLISKEGAAHIIANELGVKLFQVSAGLLKIKDVLPGMRSVETVGKVTNVFEPRDFDTGSRKGKVGNFIISDETGSIRVTLWNDMVEKMQSFESGKTIIKIKNGYVRQNNLGNKELHLNDSSALVINPPGIEIEERKSERKKIIDVQQEDASIELLGHIVDIFTPTFFEVCPACSRRLTLGENGFECQQHGKVEASFSYVVNILLDDGTGTIRIACWRNQADKLFENMMEMKDKNEVFEQKKAGLLGTMVAVRGKITKNNLNNNLEMSAFSMNTKPNPEAEVEQLQKELEELDSIQIQEEEIK